MIIVAGGGLARLDSEHNAAHLTESSHASDRTVADAVVSLVLGLCSPSNAHQVSPATYCSKCTSHAPECRRTQAPAQVLCVAPHHTGIDYRDHAKQLVMVLTSADAPGPAHPCMPSARRR
jgi:hypothetical protein